MASQIIIAIPPTTDYTVVFPHDDLAKRFDTGFYSPALTDGRASKEEIEQVLREVEAVRKPFASKIVSAVCCYILSLFAAIGGFIFLMISVGGGPGGDMIPFYIIGYIAFLVAIIVVFALRIKSITEQMKTKCREVLDRQNQNFASRGLRWHIPVHFPRWVELWKDYRAGAIAQPIYMPPVNQQPYSPVPNYGAPNQNMNMGGQSQFQQQNYYQNYQGGQNNMYIPPSQV